MKLVFMGNPDFAIPSLERLINSTHDLRAVVTNPPKRMGRGKRPQLTPVGKWARDHDLPLLQPKSLLDSAFHEQLRALESDIFVVVAYRILPKMVLSIPSIGAVNLHASILPAYRGAAPIQWALLNGDSQTGVTTFLIQPKVDTGDILMRETVDILPEDNFGSLSDRLSRVGADCLHKTLDGLTNNTIKPKPQDESQVSRAPKITPDMRWIDWENSAIKIHNQVRALTPKPGSLTIGDSKRIKILKTTPIPDFDTNKIPGTIVRHPEVQCAVQTGDGVLSVLELQREGKRVLRIQEFLRGSTLNPGDYFGDRE